MKSTTLLVLGGLLFAGTALAGEPQVQTATGASSKIAIDAKTGKRRHLNSEESAALDAKAKASRNTRTVAATGATPRPGFPATEAEAQAKAVTVGGITMVKPSAEMLNSLTVVRNADGTLTFSEDGAPVQARKQEAASE